MEKLAKRQNSECCSADFSSVRRICDKILKKFVRVVSEIYKKELKVQILNEVALRQSVRKRVRKKRTKIDQNFLASKYDIKQHSDAT